MKRKNRFITMLAAVVMTAGLMPVSAFAEEMPDPDAQAIIMAEDEGQEDTGISVDETVGQDDMAISVDETDAQDDTAISVDGTGEEQQEFEEEFLETNAGEESGGESTEVLNPLDFVTDPSSRSGGGWSWDQDTATLTITGVWVNLTDYDQDYTAAIMLPDGQATINVSNTNLINCYGTNQGGDRRIGIYCAGDLVIKGKDVLQAYGEDGAAGIRADGSITIEKQGSSSDTFQILASGTDYAISAGKTLTMNDTRFDLKVTGAAGVNAGIYAGNTDTAVTSIEMSGCETHVTQYGSSVAGIVTAGGELSIKDSVYYQFIGDQTVTSTGIVNENGDVSIDNSNMEILLDSNAPDFGKLIAAYADQGNSANIKISNNSDIIGTSYNEGFVALNGGIEIGDSDINLRTDNEGLEAGPKGLSVTNSLLSVKSAQGSFAACSEGAVTIDNSQVYLEANAEKGCALQSDDQVTISNEMSYVDLTGQMAAIEIVTAPDVSEMPLTLTDGLTAVEGGTQQYADAESDRIFSYSDSTLEIEGDELKGASKQVVFANPSEVNITGQPDDAFVAYPDGAAFEVTLNDPSKAESYQWYVDIPSSHTQTIKLDGPTSNQSRLEIPCTMQRNLAWYFYCEIKTTDGNVLRSRRAVLDMNNRDDDMTVIYAGWNAIKPGQSLDLSTVGLGSGTIILDANETTITFDNVKFDNKGQIWDDMLIPTYGIRLARHLADEPEYELILKGDCSILNTYVQEISGLSGMALDFEFYGTGGLQPLVHINEDPAGGSLSITSGTYDLRVIGDLDLNADLTLNPAPGTFVHGISCEGFNLGSGYTADLTSKGIGISAMKKITICDGAKLKINMGTPPSSGSTVGTGAIFAGGDSLEIGDGAELDITCHITPLDDGKRVSGIGGIMLVNGTKMSAKGAKITIGMSADPGDTLYASEFDGIMGGDGSDISLDQTELSISIDGTNIGSAAALYTQGNVSMTDCAVSVDATALASINGIVPEGNLKITDSTVDVNTEYIPYQGKGSSIAIAANIMFIDFENADHYVRANVKNADGIAMLVKTGKSGAQAKGYDPSYKAKYLHLQGLAKCTFPEKNAVSLTSIPGAKQPYLYLETFYDLNDTSKPASAVTIETSTDISDATVTPEKTKYTYTGSKITPKVTVTLGKTVLKQDRDYTVRYSNNKNVGKATITVTGKGSYTGKATCTFKIVPKGTSLTSVTGGKQQFTAKWKKQTVQTTGYQIQYSTSKTFASGNKTVTVKSAKTTSKTITGLKSNTTYYVRIRTYKTVDGTNYYSGWSAKKIVPKGTSLTSVTGGKQKFTAKWKKQTAVTGYQIQYSTTKDFSSGNKTVTISSAKTASKTIKNLKSKKTYYVRIRTYKTVDGTKCYSEWSAKKSVKIS